jgi:hypothetical protein
VNTRIILVWCAGLVIAAAMTGRCGIRAREAQRAAGVLTVRYERVSNQAASLASLRLSVPAPAGNNTVQGGLAQRLSAALVVAGIPASALSALSPESEVPVDRSGSGRKRRRAAVTLVSVTLSQVGALLDTWRQREPAWVITSVDLSPQAGAAPPAGGGGGGELPLRIVVALEINETAPPGSDR